jgi:hypothetical protein
MKLLLLFALLLQNINTAPSDKKSIVVFNQCQHHLKVGYQTNGEPRGTSVHLDQGQAYTLPVPVNWGGRVWARQSCIYHDCELAGAGNPASLAEFKFSPLASDIDYYDVSFVDGYNLPMSIQPRVVQGIDHVEGQDDRHCRVSECKSLPFCPHDLATANQEGSFVSCESACSKYGLDQYCCTGNHSTPETCTTNHFAKRIKDQCPEAYSYAFDDATSVYGCRSNAYHVTFCP